MDLAYQPDENDLVIGTFGRAAYIIDNIAPLRELARNKNFVSTKLKLFDIPDAYMEYNKRPAGSRFASGLEYLGENERPNAMVTFWVQPDTSKKGKNTKIKLSVFDEEGTNIRNLEPKFKAGFNRTYWYLDAKGVRFPGGKKPQPGSPERGGSKILPGKYKIVISYGDLKDSAFVNVKFDSRIKLNISDLKERKLLTEQVVKLVSATTTAVDNLDEMKKALDLFVKESKNDTTFKDLKKTAKEFLDTIKTMREEVIQPKEKGIRQDESKISYKLRRAFWTVQGYHDKPGEREKLVIKEAEKVVLPFIEKVNTFQKDEWKEFIDKVNDAGFTIFKLPNPVKLEKQQK